ncbi:RBBP9/YdeN family alpha/beta hydrolase [Dokdonella sp. MW10]|uniref:RBBP9/YdeN family alpha/beta hydrolase n=1 Tax=Dokdonella sp. MW10 TaxID=2992926 RepID=UPI003F81B5F8
MSRSLPFLLASSIAASGCATQHDASRAPVRVVIVHGYAASPSDHWFAWLERELEARGAEVSIVSLPSPSEPKPGEWQHAIETQVPVLDADTWFVAHSLGSIAVLRFLASQGRDTTIGGYALVSGFNERLPLLPQLDDFIVADLDHARLAGVTPTRIVIAARDDAIVPFAASERLAASLDARFIAVERGGHFLGSDGFTTFPLILIELDKALATRR